MYRVEVFDMYQKASKGVFFVDDSVQLEYDYISPKVFSLKAPKDFDADLRNTLEIYHDSNPMARVNTCYVKDVERTDDATVLTVAPLIMLLNEKSVQNVQSNTWGLQLWWQIHYDFIQATPSLYSVPWHYWSALPYTNWAGVTKPYGATLLNDMDCIIEARKTVGKYMTFAIGTLSSNLGHPYFGFLTGGSTPKVIEADLDNIIEKKISETTQGGYNIAMLWYPSAEGSTHYIHSDAVLIDGVIYADGSRKSEIAEPRLASKVIETPNPDSDTVWQFFREMLKPTSDNYEIELTVALNDTLIEPASTPIGRKTKIISNGREYDTYYTGWVRQGDLITMKFGTIRQSLTAILNSEED